MYMTYFEKLPASTVFSMKLALESSKIWRYKLVLSGPYDEITFLQLVIFHAFGFYLFYLINSLLEFLDASAGYCISLSWNCNWRKENAAASIFGWDYCTARVL